MPPTQRNQTSKDNKPAGVAPAAVDTSGAITPTAATAVAGAPKQEFQETPNPELQAALTDPERDLQEQHIVEDGAVLARDERSAEAPGIRTEAEVVAAHQAANERAAEALRGGHTADPAVSTSAVKMPRVENRERQVYFRNRVSGRVDSVNEGTPEHGVVLGDPDFEMVSRSAATDYAKSLG
ncbi:hypothetical protein [Blastococcus sp. CT_GayMR16]|uniref:hypothetical protein n=1 Tax=Blastococcus sp. CT_GayMR16 TaxID=2559607 RepID=UPI001072F6C3|nr:hypothetical protein [Blastococcus sp. CT_GayMR16]TFV91402.1 hypothetical protein E4P38_02100 [Blastococcus sp. CT_GayMR16]